MPERSIESPPGVWLACTTPLVPAASHQKKKISHVKGFELVTRTRGNILPSSSKGQSPLSCMRSLQYTKLIISRAKERYKYFEAAYKYGIGAPEQKNLLHNCLLDLEVRLTFNVFFFKNPTNDIYSFFRLCD